ncbi:hypothetical protein LSAT2_011623 [Lamellibrachia satsuma]|nr:hypothetical protein LSAT2_011623 [Lamellibrachia satsuma]
MCPMPTPATLHPSFILQKRWRAVLINYTIRTVSYVTHVRCAGNGSRRPSNIAGKLPTTNARYRLISNPREPTTTSWRLSRALRYNRLNDRVNNRLNDRLNV